MGEGEGELNLAAEFFCLFVGLVAAAVLAFSLRDARKFAGRRILRPQAKVVGVRQYSDDDGSPRYDVRYEFREENGAKRTVTVEGQLKGPTLGDQVQLAYPEGYPDRASPHFEVMQRIWLYGSLVALAVCLAYAPFGNWREFFFFVD